MKETLICDYDEDVFRPWKCKRCDLNRGVTENCDDYDSVDSIKTVKPDKISNEKEYDEEKLAIKTDSNCSIENTKHEVQLQCGKDHKVKFTKSFNIKLIGVEDNWRSKTEIKELADEENKIRNTAKIENLFADHLELSKEFIEENKLQFEIDNNLKDKLEKENPKIEVFEARSERFSSYETNEKVRVRGKEYFDINKEEKEFIEPGLSPKYAKNWDQSMALREFIANAFDVTPKDESIEVKKKDGNWVLFYDTEAKLKRKHFQMGEHEEYKTKEEVIGQFGEGIKVAASVLHRQGINLKIEGIGTTWYPVIEESEQWGGNPTLRVYMEPNNRKKGTKVTFTNLNYNQVKKAKNKFLHFRDDYKKLDTIDNNDIIQFEDDEGRIAIRDLVVDPGIETLLSYNLNDKKIQDRDREKIRERDIKDKLSDAIKKTDSRKVAKKIIEAFEESKDVKETSTYIYPKNKDLWMDLIEEKYGEKVVIGSHQIADLNATDLGYEVIDWGFKGNALLEDLGIEKSNNLKGAKGEIEVVSPRNLTKEQRKNLDLALSSLKHLREHHWDDKDPEKDLDFVKVAEDFEKVEGGENVEGMNDPFGKEQIFIKEDQLNDPSDATGTLIHEYIHYRTGASDRTRRFENIFTNISGLSTKEWYGTEEELKSIREGIKSKMEEMGLEPKEREKLKPEIRT